MKFVVVLIALFACVASAAPEPPLEVKVASIDAGKWIDPSDTSVARIKALLGNAQAIYATPQTELADISARVKEMAKQKGLTVSIGELLDFALIACETKCTKKQFADSLTNYMLARSTAGQSHHQATRGFVILSNLEKRLSK